jgi:hypothetical protein
MCIFDLEWNYERELESQWKWLPGEAWRTRKGPIGG